VTSASLTIGSSSFGYGLDVARLPANKWYRPLRCLWRDFLDGCNVLVGDGTSSVALDSVVDGVDLDRVRKMVCEVDHHAQAEEEQNDRPTNSQPRIDLGPRASLQADSEQTCRTVDKGRQEHAEDNLSGAISEEIAQDSRRELGRRQLERDNRQAEDKCNNCDDGAADGDEQYPGIVGSALKGQPTQAGTWSYLDLGDGEASSKSEQRGRSGQHPQRSADVLLQGA
jgi:hypothetical protein